MPLGNQFAKNLRSNQISVNLDLQKLSGSTRLRREARSARFGETRHHQIYLNGISVILRLDPQ